LRSQAEPTRTADPADGGFTLVEVLVALAIVTVVGRPRSNWPATRPSGCAR
jgi:prepilin-type N-terminal cleavage/methylation domain-containing protein